MLPKIKLIIFVAVVLSASIYYFSTNPSYQDSIQARVYYYLGNYSEAYKFAKRAYVEDSYNKMANTIMVQSAIAKEYEEYIGQGSSYLKKIREISAKKDYNEADRARIRMMCDIMINSFDNITYSDLIQKSLVKRTRETKNEFVGFCGKLF